MSKRRDRLTVVCMPVAKTRDDALGRTAWVTLDPSIVRELMRVGIVGAVERGDVLYRAGGPIRNFFVVLAGEVEVVRAGDDGDVVVVAHGPGRFVGELGMLTEQRAFLTARVTKPGRVLAVQLPVLRALMAASPALSDAIFPAMVARREVLRTGTGSGSIRIVGSRYSPETMALRSFAQRSGFPHVWIDLDDVDDADVLLASIGLRPADVPVVITPMARLRHPTQPSWQNIWG